MWQKTESLVERAKQCFFGPMRVSILSDPNGSNTTAAAAVICAQQEIDLGGKTISILAGTGPVGQRIAQIIAGPASAGGPATTIRGLLAWPGKSPESFVNSYRKKLLQIRKPSLFRRKPPIQMRRSLPLRAVTSCLPRVPLELNYSHRHG